MSEPYSLERHKELEAAAIGDGFDKRDKYARINRLNQYAGTHSKAIIERLEMTNELYDGLAWFCERTEGARFLFSEILARYRAAMEAKP